jgi:hypothetical protein
MTVDRLGLSPARDWAGGQQQRNYQRRRQHRAHLLSRVADRLLTMLTLLAAFPLGRRRGWPSPWAAGRLTALMGLTADPAHATQLH